MSLSSTLLTARNHNPGHDVIPLNCEDRRFSSLSGDFGTQPCQPFTALLYTCAYAPLDYKSPDLKEHLDRGTFTEADMFTERASCVEFCALFTTDSYVGHAVRCGKEQCRNFERDYADLDVETLKSMGAIKESYEHYLPHCVKMGLAPGAEGSPANSTVPVQTDKPVSNEDGKDKDVPSTAALDQKPKGSSASSVKGWKGASLVVALALGSVFLL